MTENCPGTVTEDPNRETTNKSNLTHVTYTPVVKHYFTRQKQITAIHNFGHIGSLILDVFLYAFDSSGNQVSVKTTDYAIVDQTKNTVTIELTAEISSASGVVIVTDNQFFIDKPKAAKEVGTVTILRNNVLTIAVDGLFERSPEEVLQMSVEVRDMTNFTRNVTGLSQLVTSRHPVVFYNHRMFAYNSVIANSSLHSSRMLIMGKRYNLYSAAIDPKFLARGTTAKLIYPGDLNVFVPISEADKSSPGDAIKTTMLTLSTHDFGDIIADGVQWVVTNQTLLINVDPPYILI